MCIYLYVKTHNKTGLKYLGKTTAKDPHKYRGSGLHWVRHLKMHGPDYSTEILKECINEAEIKHWGGYYSALWNIVESSDWANLKPELGEGGSAPVQTAESNAKRSITLTGKYKGRKGRPQSSETIEKRSKALKGKTYEEIHGKEKAEELRRKRSDSLRGIKRLIKNPRQGKPTEKNICRLIDGKEMNISNFNFWCKNHPNHLTFNH